MEVSRLHDVLGGLVERSPGLFVALGRLETRCVGDALENVRIDRPIFVAGLARAGSTILLELLADHTDVATHRYRDFPLVHIPVWWNWFLDRAAGSSGGAVERAHQDGIRVTPESPEAMEEVVWMAFFPECHEPETNNVLDARERGPDFAPFYRDLIRKVLLTRGRSRYLAKGNYHVCRLGFLRSLFPDARFVIPVRDPVGHIASLMKQHALFCAAETRDPRVLDYMRRAGHFEFGLDRRPINFGDAATVARIRDLWRKGEEVRGWAAYWSAVYAHIADVLQRDAVLAGQSLIVHYQDLCRDALGTLRRVFDHCELPVGERTLSLKAARIRAPDYYAPAFSDQDVAVIRDETDSTAARVRALASM